MDIVFRENVLGHLLRPSIETYLNGKTEFIAEIYGFKDKERFILEDVYIDITSKRKKYEVTPIPKKIFKKINENLDGIVTAEIIGDLHSHVDGKYKEELDKAENKKTYLKNMEKMSHPTEYDKRSMLKDGNKVYIIVSIVDKKYHIKWSYANDEKSIRGNTKDFTFFISAWYYHKRKRKFDKAKIIARNVLGNQQKAL